MMKSKIVVCNIIGVGPENVLVKKEKDERVS